MTIPAVSFLLAFLGALAGSVEWRLVHTDGQVETATGKPRLGPDTSTLRSAWTWSGVDAPRRVEPGAVSAFRPVTAFGDPGRLSVRVVRPPESRPPADARVIAAPLAAWIEIPEDRLPAWPVPRDGRLALPFRPGERWRLRYVAEGEGTWWVDVPAGASTAVLAPVPARGIDLRVVDAQGASVEGVAGALLEAENRQGGSRFWTTLLGAGGRVRVPGLPDVAEVGLTLRKGGFAPRSLRRLPGDLRGEVSLLRGAVIEGRFVDPAGRPIADVAVELEAWLAPGMPQPVTYRLRSATDGSWKLPGIPPGTAVLTARAADRSAYRQVLEVPADDLRLGAIELAAARGLAVRVRDEAGTAVPGAEVVSPPGARASTDAAGQVRLADLSGGAVELQARAPGHRPVRRKVNPPYPEEVELTLRRAFRLRGRFVNEDRKPLPEAAVQAKQESCSLREKTLGDGTFTLDLEAGEGTEIALVSPSARELRLQVEPGEGGTERDLGDLVADRGRAVRGRLVAAEDGRPLAAGRIWALRAGSDGPAIAWANRDVLTAASDAEGRFELWGLGSGGSLLRVEALGRARTHLEVPAGNEPVDLGSIALGTGATVTVRIDNEPGEVVARLDLRGDWLEPDQLTASFVGGEARFLQVPPGTYPLSVLAGRELVCFEQVKVPSDGAEVEIACGKRDHEVVGVVSLGPRRVRSGTLAWLADVASVPARIDHRTTPGGLRLDSVVGSGPPQIDVAVDTEGRFQTTALFPGHWRVAWIGNGGITAELRVAIPDVDRYEVDLAFEGAKLSGVVVDERDRPVAGAQVREVAQGATAFSDQEGLFRLSGLPLGRARVEARLGELQSQPVEVKIVPDAEAAPVRLKLAKPSSEAVAIVVVDSADRAVASAFVFLEDDEGGLELLTADARGRLAWKPSRAPRRFRWAVFGEGTWSLGGWFDFDAAREGLRIAIPPGGGLAVSSGTISGRPEIDGPQGWRLDRLLLLLGMPFETAPGRRSELSGLPPGLYSLHLLAATYPIAVKVGEVVDLQMP